MKGLVVTGPNEMSIKEIPYPKLQKDTAIVQVDYTLMCSSDVKLLNGDYHGLKYPHTPGHEFSGTVVESYHKENVGKRVVVDTLMPCKQCEFCRRGQTNLCEHLAEIGDNRPGSFAEYVLVREENMYEIPENTTTKAASLIEPLAVALNAIDRANIRGHESVTVLGAGVIGLLIINTLKHNKIPFIRAIEMVDYRLKLAKQMGADETILVNEKNINSVLENTQQTDIVFDATGNPEGFNHAITIVKPAGTISYVSYPGEVKTLIKPSQITLKALNIFGVLSPFATWNEAIALFRDGAIKTNLLITHETKLENFAFVKKIMENKEDNVIRAAMTLR